jgi:hypothetical protein
MIRAGVVPARATKDPFERQYGHLSEFVHNRRRHLADIAPPSLRVMPMGRHPDVRVRAATVGDSGLCITEAVTVCGHALAGRGHHLAPPVRLSEITIHQSPVLALFFTGGC